MSWKLDEFEKGKGYKTRSKTLGWNEKWYFWKKSENFCFYFSHRATKYLSTDKLARASAKQPSQNRRNVWKSGGEPGAILKKKGFASNHA